MPGGRWVGGERRFGERWFRDGWLGSVGRFGECWLKGLCPFLQKSHLWPFSATLGGLELHSVDLLFVDGDHDYNATLQDLRSCLAAFFDHRPFFLFLFYFYFFRGVSFSLFRVIFHMLFFWGEGVVTKTILL